MANLIGTAANQVPVNGMLGTSAFINKEELPVSTAVQTALNLKQNVLVSGTNIRTVNGQPLLGSTDLVITSAPGYEQTFLMMGA